MLVADYPSGEARLAAMLHDGAIYPPGQYADILRANIQPTEPPELAMEFGLAEGHELITRLRVTHEGGRPVTLSTSYFHPKHARIAPDLLRPERIRQGTVGYLAGILGTVVRRSREQVWADAAELDGLATQRLRVDPGSPLLWGQVWWSAPDGQLLELGVSVTLPRLRKTYERVVA
jgi:DNA-binding GntR family transcriptional regulator